MITYLGFQKSLSMTSKPQQIPELGRNESVTYLNKAGESIMSVLEEDHLLKIASIGGLPTICLRQLQISIYSELGSKWIILTLAQLRWKVIILFQHPIFVK